MKVKKNDRQLLTIRQVQAKKPGARLITTSTQNLHSEARNQNPSADNLTSMR